MKKYSETDYIASSLPSTRKQQYIDILKHNKGTLISIGVTLVFFFIPLLLCLVFEDIFNYNLLTNPIYYTAGEFTSEGLALYKSNTFMFSIYKGISYVFVFIGLAGIFKILKKLFWSEHIFYFHMLMGGIKESFLNAFLLGLIFGLSRVLIAYTQNLDLHFALNALIYGLLVFIVLPILIVGLGYSSFYNGNIIKVIHHSFIMYARNLFYILGLALIIFALSFLSYIPNFIVKDSVIFVVIFLIGPLFLLMWYGFIVHIFDKCINREYYPNIYQKGLYIDDGKSIQNK